MAELVISVDKTFVPAVLVAGSKDPRELGVRVFHALHRSDGSDVNELDDMRYRGTAACRVTLCLVSFVALCARARPGAGRAGVLQHRPDAVGQGPSRRRRLAGAGAAGRRRDRVRGRASSSRVRARRSAVPGAGAGSAGSQPAHVAVATVAVAVRRRSSIASRPSRTCRSKLVRAVIQVESAYSARARSPKGAMGLMQLMPATARQYARRRPLRSGVEHRGRHQAPEVAARSGCRVALALAAYNAGEAAVQRFNGIPPYPETRNYVRASSRSQTDSQTAQSHPAFPRRCTV